MDITLVFLTGFFGSMHCVGMCGAIVAAYSTQENFQNRSGGKWNPLLKHLVYNFGRVLSYVFVGALLGAVGGGFSGLKSAGEWFSTAVGALLIVSGIWMMRIFPWMGFKREIAFTSEKKSFLLNVYTKTYGMLLASSTVESKFYIGLLTPLLPCGLLYSMFVMAAASGSAVNGAVTMALFGSGIVPSLIIVGFVSTFFRLQLRVWGDKLAAITIVVMGIIMVMRGQGVPMPWMMMGGEHRM
ncbi:MAG: sulfite exporter TauE/SafE family protein [Bacteroidota bacterium]